MGVTIGLKFGTKVCINKQHIYAKFQFSRPNSSLTKNYQID